MKIQLKRSNVLESSKAKAPTPSQMEYGEIAVNYNTTDPVLFIKDSSDAIIRLTNSTDVNDGAIQIDAGDGLVATGDNGSANQSGDTTRVLAAVADVGYGIAVAATGLRLGDEWTNIPALPTVAP